MDLWIVFDRDDCVYRFGETVSGNVLVQPDSNRTYSEIWITYRWRTHGKGNRDEGSEQKLTLAAQEISIGAGRTTKFPFAFAAPDGPVTYHGYSLSVDWYVTAHARSGLLHHAKHEQDFLLVAGDATGPIVLGNQVVPRAEIPARPAGSSQSWQSWRGLVDVKTATAKASGLGSNAGKGLGCLTSLLLGLLWVVGGTFVSERLDLNPLIAFGVLVISVILVGVARAYLRANLYKRQLELGEAWVRPATVYPGSEVGCHVDFVAKRGFHLGSITASITGRERVTKGSGTTEETEINVLDEKSCTRACDEDVYEGKWTVFDCTLPVRPDAPASFSSKNNALEWIVTMKADVKGWPDWSKDFPITVLP